jgi:hypothetical protein
MPGGNHLRETAEMSRAVFLFVVLMAGFMPVAHSQDVGFVQDVANRIWSAWVIGRAVRNAGGPS